MIEFENVTFRYSDSDKIVLNDINLEISEGEFVLLVGKSGCGKSTLCRLINGLIPHFYGGFLSGKVTIDGIDTRKVPPSMLAGIVGTIFQDPENQLVMTNVENELAFGLENLAIPEWEIKERISLFSQQFNLDNLLRRFIPELSGGEKQRVAFASILAMSPKYLILDEPTSQLDMQNAINLLEALRRLNRLKGITIILVEHRLDRCIDYADRVILIKDGEIAFDGGKNESLPILIKENLMRTLSPRTCCHIGNHEESVLSAHDIWFSYDNSVIRNISFILRGVDFEVKSGEIVAITGENGCGKSTLMKILNGLLKPQKGIVKLFGEDISNKSTAQLAASIGYLSQNPNDYLIEKNLQKELEFTLTNLNIPKEEWQERIDWILSLLDLARYRMIFPRDLSCGERERAALASILVSKPKILILDEPTRGLDQSSKDMLGNLLRSLQKKSIAIIIVTHDYRFIIENATRIFNLRNGKLIEISIDELYATIPQSQTVEQQGGVFA